MNKTSPTSHTETIRCPACGKIQQAIVEHTAPWWSYYHHCNCSHSIIESEWEVVYEEFYDSEAKAVVELSAELIAAHEKIAASQEKFLGLYADEQLSGDCDDHHARAIRDAIANGEQSALVQTADDPMVSVDERLEPRAMVHVHTQKINIRPILIFGRDSEWFCFAASWGTGGYISPARRVMS